MIRRNMLFAAGFIIIPAVLLFTTPAQIQKAYSAVRPPLIDITEGNEEQPDIPEIDIYGYLNNMLSSSYSADINMTIHSVPSEEDTSDSVAENITTKILSIISDGTYEHTVGQTTSSFTPDKQVIIETYASKDGDKEYTIYDSVTNGDNIQWEKSTGISIGAQLFNDESYLNLIPDDNGSYTGSFEGTIDSTYISGTASGKLENDRICEINIQSDDGNKSMIAKISEGTLDSVSIPVTVIDETKTESEVNIDVENGAISYITAANVNLRESPSTESEILEEIPVGTTVGGSPYRDGWGEITYKGKTGYISLDFLIAPTDRKSYSTTRDVNLRKEMSLESEILTIIPEHTVVFGLSNDEKWVKVNYDHVTGYVAKDCLQSNELQNNQSEDDQTGEEAGEQETVSENNNEE